MFKLCSMAATLVVASFFFFPFVFSFLPETNTKMMVALFGTVALGFNLAKNRDSFIDKGFFTLSLWAFGVSLVSFMAVTLNGTSDYTYVSYIVSMWVWLGGAYAVTRLIKATHGAVSIQMVCNYLTGVCVIQCLIAFAMGQIPILKDFVDSFLASEGFMGKVDGRLYGIGASLDVAGMRFAAVLVAIVYLCVSPKSVLSKRNMTLYILSLIVIVSVGNMIGRSTIIGVGVAFVYLILTTAIRSQTPNNNIRMFWKILFVILLFFIPVLMLLYRTNPIVHDNLRFGFEGFFNLFETGHWEVHSNEMLKHMFVFPDNIKTWLIGDGYFENPYYDIFYTGKQWLWYYHNTDVGYCRFIFYFGLTGTIVFVVYMFLIAAECMKRFSGQRVLFLLILFVNYVMWLKVSSDLFPVFALFLCVSQAENEEYQKKHSVYNRTKIDSSTNAPHLP